MAQKRALISVYNKTGVFEFAKSLHDLGFELISTGGTFQKLKEGGLPVHQVSDVTSFPEILGGRVKTLHPSIHGGILARRTEEHLKELEAHKITPIDLVVCNLYPFEETIKKQGVTEKEIIEEIDIGGVTLLRAAAKNFESVVVVCDPADYTAIAEDLKNASGISVENRRKFALKAFRHTATYDAGISNWFTKQVEGPNSLPSELILTAERAQVLRYGENPHQQGAWYYFKGAPQPFLQLQGQKELSYNNIWDVEAAWAIPKEFSEPCCAIIKHCTPCGLAIADTLLGAYKLAFESDPVSAFGSIIAVNREVDQAFVDALGSLFVEVLVAPSFSAEALQTLTQKKKNCRILQANPGATEPGLVIHSVYGGLLVQTPDLAGVDFAKWKVVSKKQPTEEQKKALAFAWLATKHVKSNAIVLVQGTSTVGVGTGQPNRVDSVWLAAKRAGDRAKNSVLGSDAFFPFPDGVEAAAQSGVIAVIQPGGSVKDQEVIDTADKHDLVMVFTGERHFKH